MSLVDTLKGIGDSIINPGFGAVGPAGPGTSVTSGLSLATGTTKQSMTLTQLWTENGGSPAEATIAAAIAIAESNRGKGCTNGKCSCNNNVDNKTCCACLWQVNYLAHPQYDKKKLLSDPNYCAKAAVAIKSGQGWGAWQTFTEGTYKKFLGQDCNVTTDPGLGASTAAAVSNITDPLQAIANFFYQLGQASTWFRVGKVLLGAILLIAVMYMLIKG